MRVFLFLAPSRWRGLCAASAHATLRPVTAAGRALLARPATYEEQIAEQVARRLTRSQREGPLRLDRRVRPARPRRHAASTARSADYFLMRPAAVHGARLVPSGAGTLGPAHAVSTSDCARVANMAMALAVGRARVVPPARVLERGAGRVLRHAVDLVRRLEARRVASRSRRRSPRSTRRRCIRCGARRPRVLVGAVPRTAASSTCGRARWPSWPS